jgi:hypothetical protein
METEPTDAEFWAWFRTLSKDEQLAAIEQCLTDHPEEFTQLPNGNWIPNKRAVKH